MSLIFPNNHKLFGNDSLLICGRKGAGKTATLVRILLEDRADFIVSNIELDFERFIAFRKSQGRDVSNVKVFKRDSQSSFGEFHCAVRGHDEIGIEYQARSFGDRSPEKKKGLEVMKEERKDDSRQVSTCQMYRDVDVLASGMHERVIQLRPLLSLPFIGWINPDCVRPTIVCSGCGKIHRHGKGNQSTFFERSLGFGTVVLWDEIDPELSASARSMTQENEDVIVDSGWFFWSQKSAEVYRTFGRVRCSA